MIENTFIFLDNIGYITERRLWGQGIFTWDDFIEAEKIYGISDFQKRIYDLELRDVRKRPLLRF